MTPSFEIPPAPSLAGCITRRRVDRFRYARGQIAADGSVLLRWWADRRGLLWEEWAPSMEAVDRIKAYRRWQSQYSPAGIRARQKAAQIREARRQGRSEDEIRASFMLGRVQYRPKVADPLIYPTAPTPMATPVVAAAPEVRFGKRATAKRWLTDPLFAPTWAFFLHTRRIPGLTEVGYAELCAAVRPHAEAALARWHAEELALGFRGTRPGWKASKRRQRLFSPGTLATPLRDMWPPAPARTRREAGDTPQDEATNDPADAGRSGPEADGERPQSRAGAPAHRYPAET